VPGRCLFEYQGSSAGSYAWLQAYGQGFLGLLLRHSFVVSCCVTNILARLPFRQTRFRIHVSLSRWIITWTNMLAVCSPSFHQGWVLTSHKQHPCHPVLARCCVAVAGVCLQVRVGGDVAHVLSLPRAQLDSFLGPVGVGLASKAAILQVLQQCKSLRVSTLVCGAVRGHPGLQSLCQHIPRTPDFFRAFMLQANPCSPCDGALLQTHADCPLAS
jgi:hypothetical protein